jgi:hypothetical protein
MNSILSRPQKEVNDRFLAPQKPKRNLLQPAIREFRTRLGIFFRASGISQPQRSTYENHLFSQSSQIYFDSLLVGAFGVGDVSCFTGRASRNGSAAAGQKRRFCWLHRFRC